MRIGIAWLSIFVSLFIIGRSSARAQSCCILPTPEMITVGDRQGTLSGFTQTIPSGNFNGVYVQETSVGTTTGTNTCWWAGSGLNPNPAVSGGEWGVGVANPNGSTGPTPETNVWGYDYVGINTTGINLIRSQGPQNGISLSSTSPCTYTAYQTMQIQCAYDSGWQTYQTNNALTTQVFTNKVVNSRRGVSDSISY